MKKRMITTCVVNKSLVIGCLLLLFGAVSTTGTTPYVPAGHEHRGTIIVPDDYPTIQAAIDAAVDGDTIFVFNGTYREHINVNKRLNIIGEDKEVTIIDGEGGNDIVTVVENNVLIDGFTIINGSKGINAISIDGLSITDNFIINTGDGIVFSGSHNSKIENNTIMNCGDGVYLSSSCNNIVSKNTISLNNENGITLYSHADNNEILNNTIGPGNSLNGVLITHHSSNNVVLGNEILEVIEEHGIEVFYQSPNNSIIGNVISQINHCGIHIYWDSGGCLILENTISDTGYSGIYTLEPNTIIKNCTVSGAGGDGIGVSMNNDCLISGNIISSSRVGLRLGGFRNYVANNIIRFSNKEGICIRSSNNTISHNIIENNGDEGICSDSSSSNNHIFDNIIMKNRIGLLFFENCDDNKIYRNTIIDHEDWSVLIGDLGGTCDNNLLFHNNFINDTVNVDDECTTFWDNGYPSGGNYWSDYNGTDDDGDGIGDTSYFIPGGDNQDRYPFISPNGWEIVCPNLSLVSLSDGGLTTCPEGNGPIYQYLGVSVRTVAGAPIFGIPASAFEFSLCSAEVEYFGNLTCTFTPVYIETDENGEIRFEIVGDTSIVGNLIIRVTVNNILLQDTAILQCNSFDYNVDGVVNLIDFGEFADDYGSTSWLSDFNWDGVVDLVDFGLFTHHYGHHG